MSGPTVRYPAGPITPAGAYHILRNRKPMVALQSYDESVVFNMMGGLSIHDQMMPERVDIRDIKGLIPPWQTIDQKGATQDGTSFVDAIYDPIEVELNVTARGRNPAMTRKVVNHLYGSLDAKQNSELSWITHELGRWWAPIRWFKVPTDSVGGIHTNRQDLQLRLRADDGFWRSYDNVDDFSFTYEDMTETFNFVDTDDLGTGWTLTYSNPGHGHISSSGSQAVWVESGTAANTMVGRKNSFTTTTDDQVVNIILGTFGEWRFLGSSFVDLWARMNNTGTPGTSGIRLRLAGGYIRLSYFVGGAEAVIREWNIFNFETWIPPFPGEKFTLVAGQEGDHRLIQVLRNGSLWVQAKELGSNSLIGAANRSIGFGVVAGPGLFDQANPAQIQKVSAGDNATVSQVGYLERINAGDQPMWDRFTCFGPGTFRFGNGPNSTDMVEFGKLLPNQVMYLRTDPRKKSVVDMTSVPPTPQELDFFQQALKDFISWSTGNNVPPYYQAIESQFGILPPQGNPFSLLKGRWSNPIPAKSPGKPAEKYHIRVEIDDGNASSKVIAAGTPLRRNPY